MECVGCAIPDIALCAACGPQPHDRVVDLVAGVSVIAAGSYDGPLRRAIVAMKHGERAYLGPLAALLVDLGPAGVPLVPLPTTARRRAVRGFDQSLELARRAAADRGTRSCELLVKRGGPQRGRDRQARLAAGAGFSVRRGVPIPEAALVVDDVCTTGATLADGIAALRTAGVAVLGAIVVARTPPGRNPRH